MATAVFFHAHPDDEVLSTGGTMALASRAGHRVVVVCATDGARGQPLASDSLGPDRSFSPGRADPSGAFEGGSVPDLAAVREAELRAAAQILGVHRVEMLGYVDSGMEGEPGNDDPDCFWQADLDGAAARLSAILVEERADLLTCYDDWGTYGHPDHIQVHRVGVRAAEMAGVGLVYEATVDRDHFKVVAAEVMAMMADPGPDGGMDESDLAELRSEVGEGRLGVDAATITHRVDVSSVVVEKRSALAAHASQVPESSFFLSLPMGAFATVFGTEWFRRRGAMPGSATGSDLFAVLAGPEAFA